MALLPDGRFSSANYGEQGSSSSWRNSFPSVVKDAKLEESDDDVFTVPEMEAQLTNDSTAGGAEVQQSNGGASSEQRRRGRDPVDREYRRLKRLLRNRVSAQQARERKKVYVNDLEAKVKELEDKNSVLQEKISTLVNENTMLRKVIMNTRVRADEESESCQKMVGHGS
ncbi:transcription factor HY5-like [Nymphaea colorata]|nr:transcription factor HY5-like [Nymphaea colorata]